MISVNMLYFASAKDITGTASESIELSDSDTTIANLQSILQTKYTKLNFKTIMFSCNCEYVDLDWKLKDGDEIALVPPVSGG
jgi:molybdopterin converting factor subunit 1